MKIKNRKIGAYLGLLQIFFFSTIIILFASLATPANSTNLIVNGDFEAGNSGFESEYTYDNKLSAYKTYTIAKTPNAVATNLGSFGDHTSGKGNMMIVRSSKANFKIWRQTVEVEPNTDYELSAFFTRLKNEKVAPKVGFYINDALIENAKFTGVPGVWQGFKEKWNSKDKTSATITLRNSTSFDTFFVFDDISLAK